MRLSRAHRKPLPAGPTVQAVELTEHMSVTGQRLIRRHESGDWSLGWVAVSNPAPPDSGHGELRVQVLSEEAWHHLAITGALPEGEGPRSVPISQVRVLTLLVPLTVF
ncbi:hypothetical protein [Streptosporangium sp. NPDC051022]|uniref:hypothetical protein n=1 Tax=Streptosporangium sp. NPDC051022 TaxID=3155752 RepID=UPI00344A147B